MWTRTRTMTEYDQPDKQNKNWSLKSLKRVRSSYPQVTPFYLRGALEHLMALVEKKVFPFPLKKMKTFLAPNGQKQSQDSTSERH